MKKISFLVFMMACVAIFCTLGTWQIKRLHWKENLIAQIDQAYASEILPTPVEADKIVSLEKDHFIRGTFFGHFDFKKSFELSGQIDNGQQTSHLMVPLEISKEVTVLVDLGHDMSPQRPTRAKITGLLKQAPQPNRFTPENDPGNNTWYSINPDQLNIPNLKPLVIIPEKTPWKEYSSQKPELRNNHQQYAIFWFAMAVITSVLTVIYLRKKQAI